MKIPLRLPRVTAPGVAIVVEKSASGAQRFRQKFSAERATVVAKSNPRGIRNVGQTKRQTRRIDGPQRMRRKRRGGSESR